MAAKNSPADKNSGSILKDLPRPQRNAVLFLAALAVFVVIFWVWQMRAQINRPFDRTTETKKTDMVTTSDSETALKARDTDGDGLSDYDEIYVSKTSPYLEDTDSDGLSDKAEVDNGTDPNCPTGKTCTGTATEEETSDAAKEGTSATATAGTVTSSISLPSDLSASGLSETALQNVLSGQVDAATLRQLLIVGGANKEELDKISDEDLMKSYQATLQSQDEEGAAQN